MTGIEGEFESVVRRWSGEAAWYFAAVPLDLADEIRSQVEHVGFGSVRVTATCSTNACVDQALCSSCNCPHSISRLSRRVLSFSSSTNNSRARCLA